MYPPRRTRNSRNKGDSIRWNVIIVSTIFSNFVQHTTTTEKKKDCRFAASESVPTKAGKKKDYRFAASEVTKAVF